MPLDTVWDTAQSLLASLNAYKRTHPWEVIGSADSREPEPTLTWVARDRGLVMTTWSIPLRLFDVTLTKVREGGSYQDADERHAIARRIKALVKVPKKVKAPPVRVSRYRRPWVI
jgi:hypothetical protein